MPLIPLEPSWHVPALSFVAVPGDCQPDNAMMMEDET